jgi:hypothetical protein
MGRDVRKRSAGSESGLGEIRQLEGRYSGARCPDIGQAAPKIWAEIGTDQADKASSASLEPAARWHAACSQ